MQEEDQKRSLSRRFKALEEERNAKRRVEKSPLRRVFKTPSPHLCRALFPTTENRDASGKTASQGVMDCARRIIQDIADEQTRRWNFDFTTETPLPGRWQWEIVEKEGPIRRNSAISVPKAVRPLRPRQANINPPTQTRITDFLKQRRAASGAIDSKTDHLKMDVESCDGVLSEKNSKAEA